MSVDPRVPEMFTKYAAGASLVEVGNEYGISRERVRQLFREAGLSTRSRAETAAIRGKPKPAAKPRRSRVGLHPEWARKRYSDGDLIGCLQMAGETVGGVLSARSYDGFARGRVFADGRRWPTHQTAANRFGSWREALKAAGLRANPSSPIAGQRIFDRGHCIDAVRHVDRELGRTPSVQDYERFSKASGGALPSSATIRARCGSWVGALRLAGLATPGGQSAS